MKNKATPSVRQALKTALFDVGGMVLYLALFAVAVVVLWWLAGAAHAQMVRYYPLHMKSMVVTVCVMVPVLVIVSEVLNKTRDIAGKAMPGRQRIIMDVFIGALLLAEIVMTCLLLWMLFHGTPLYMLPALVVVGSLVHIGITLERQ